MTPTFLPADRINKYTHLHTRTQRHTHTGEIKSQKKKENGAQQEKRKWRRIRAPRLIKGRFDLVWSARRPIKWPSECVATCSPYPEAISPIPPPFKKKRKQRDFFFLLRAGKLGKLGNNIVVSFFLACYLVFLSLTGFCLVFLGFSGFYLVLLGFTESQLVYIEFYWVLPSFTGFY